MLFEIQLIEILNKPLEIPEFKTIVFSLGIIVLISLLVYSIRRIKDKYYLVEEGTTHIETPEIIISTVTGLFCLAGMFAMLSALFTY